MHTQCRNDSIIVHLNHVHQFNDYGKRMSSCCANLKYCYDLASKNLKEELDVMTENLESGGGLISDKYLRLMDIHFK
jgi:hypothetical protein